MAVILSDIKSADWQVSLSGAGIVEQGLMDVRQCIDILLRTRKGTDALRPEFGSDIFQYIDRPVNVSIPNMKKAIIEALEIWEKRVELVSITHTLDFSTIDFYITYKVLSEDVEDSIRVRVVNSEIIVGPPSQLILEAIIPDYDPGHPLLIEFVANGYPAQPNPPAQGFASPYHIYLWCVANWGFYGSWYLLSDRIVLYVNQGLLTSGSINIAVSDSFKVSAQIPGISNGSTYVPTIEVPPAAVVVAAQSFDTLEQMEQWLNSQWSSYGVWAIEPGNPLPGDFNEDFNDDFFVYGPPYILALYTLNPYTVIQVIESI